ncbi:MAG: hypothetical protein ACE5G1_10530, partial [bacterium]
VDICQVRIFRTTANRAAIKQLKRTKSPILQKGDKLFSSRELNAAFIPRNVQQPRAELKPRAVAKRAKLSQERPQVRQAQLPDKKMEPVTQPAPKPVQSVEPVNPRVDYSTYTHRLKTPWITFNAGAVFPYGDLAKIYSPSIQFGASYMVEAVPGLNLGIEANNSFFSSPFGSGNVVGAASTSSSLLEVHAVLQKFFGKFFFLEAGGGIYRPKVTTTSIDDFKTTLSSTNFGLFGGTGVFLPTSEYAGVVIRGRVHNYFDQTKRQYFGVSGGFRFKVQ